MGLMDKVKSQATQLAEKAQQAGQAGQAKLAEIQAKKKADAMLLELGGIAYQEKTGRADSSSGACGRANGAVEEARGRARTGDGHICERGHRGGRGRRRPDRHPTRAVEHATHLVGGTDPAGAVRVGAGLRAPGDLNH